MHLLAHDGQSTLLQELDATGVFVRSQSTELLSPLVVYRDQGIVHGLDYGGGLAAMSLHTDEEAGLWDALKGLFSTPCVPGVIDADIHPGGAGNPSRLRFAPSPTAYTFGFDDTFAGPDLKAWTSSQKTSVRRGFKKWTDTSAKHALGYSFVETTAGNPDILLRKQPLGVNPTNGRPLVGGFVGTTFAPNNRVLKGVMFFTTDQNVLLLDDGYYKTTLHEGGHAMGLEHPNLTPLYPSGIPGWSPRRVGTVMNPMGTLENPKTLTEGRDDFLNYVPRTPTKCDIEAVRRASAQ